MRFGFKPMYFDTACTPLDLDEGPATLELTRIGELVVHNWDREVDEAQAALGFDQSLCMTLTQSWWKTMTDALFHQHRGALPLSFYYEIRRVGEVVFNQVFASFSKSLYKKAGAGLLFSITGVRKDGSESVTSKATRSLLLETTLEACFDLLDAVHQGRILDEEQNEWVMAAAIVGWVTENLAFVKAGRVVPTTDPEAAPFQIRVVSSTALIEQKFSKIWVIKEWVEE